MFFLTYEKKVQIQSLLSLLSAGDEISASGSNSGISLLNAVRVLTQLLGISSVNDTVFPLPASLGDVDNTFGGAQQRPKYYM